MSLFWKISNSFSIILICTLTVQLLKQVEFSVLSQQILNVYEFCIKWLQHYVGITFISVALFLACILLQITLIQRRCGVLKSHVTTWKVLNEHFKIKFEKLKELKEDAIKVMDAFEKKSQQGYLIDLFLLIEEFNKAQSKQSGSILDESDIEDLKESKIYLDPLYPRRSNNVTKLSPEIMRVFAENIRKLKWKSQFPSRIIYKRQSI